MQEKKRLILIVIFVLTIAIINLIMIKPVQAATQSRSTEIDKIDEQKYPGVKQMIKDLQGKHPNWNFKILYTELDWYKVLMNESVGHGDSPRNLIPVGNSYTGEWVCESCTSEKYYDNGNWHCASEKTLKYMMDARNSINESDIFQFMELTYQECTVENIKAMVAGTFLDNESYINAIITAGKNHNVSPYYIVALAVQEQGRSGSTTISGTYAGYEGYYNIFNINASGNNKETIITNALTYAKNNEWNTLEKSIDGGVKKISTSYIGRGQDTLYLQKFDVDNSDGQLYWHQYQQNVMAAQNEGVTIRKTFEEINSIDSSYTFVIPVYINMPEQISEQPSKDKVINTENLEKVRVNVSSSLNLRSTPKGTIINKLNANEIVYRLEKATEKISNTYWDKVMKENGIIGYVARETYDYEPQYKLYLIPIVEEQPENPEKPEDIPADEPTDKPSDEPEQDTEIPSGGNVELPTISNEKIKVDQEKNQVIIIPETTVQQIKDLVGAEISITDKEENELGATAVAGTGSTINGNYTIVMLGDVNGDGKVKATDYMKIKNYIMNISTLEEYEKTAADVNNDEKVKATDYMKIKNYIMGISNISL